MHDTQQRWSLDANQLVNALSIGLVACLIPEQPWSENLYLTLSTLCFASLATLKHLFPRRLRQLTHVVKASYTPCARRSIGGSDASGSRRAGASTTPSPTASSMSR